MSAMQNLPPALLAELAGAATRALNDAAALYDLLDRKGCAVPVQEIQKQLALTPKQYQGAMHVLEGTSAKVYITQDGIILQKFVPTEEQRLWHLSWSLGSFLTAAEQLVLDQDLLQQVPDALRKLLAAGRLRDHHRLLALRTKAQRALGTLLKAMNMYKQVCAEIEVAVLPKLSPGNWQKQLQEMKKYLPPGPRS